MAAIQRDLFMEFLPPIYLTPVARVCLSFCLTMRHQKGKPACHKFRGSRDSDKGKWPGHIMMFGQEKNRSHGTRSGGIEKYTRYSRR
jgi:hypothetical protein